MRANSIKPFIILLFLFINLFPLLIAVERDVNINELCNATTSQRVDYEFNIDVLPKQHIITFKGYFPRSTRENYVGAALRHAGVSNWTLLKRDNPAKEYPSDFDVIILEEAARKALHALTDHPAIKRVNAKK